MTVIPRPCLLLLGLLLAGVAPAQDAPLPDGDFTELSLEDLMNLNVEVTTVSRKSESVARSPAAVYVLTSEDIRRSGALSIPEALRMVPGLHVARLNSSNYAITSRGFSSQFANKMLVLIDGRVVYTPLFSGVFWNAQDLVLEDIERIEVIRGPGATLWGANAVNGVINVITKSASKTHGTLVTLLGGNEEHGTAVVRHGGPLGDDGSYRIWGKGLARDGLHDPGNGEDDAWRMGRGGFRIDLLEDRADSFTVQGDYYDSALGGAITTPSSAPPFTATMDSDGVFRGGNVLGRWKRTLSEDSDLALQVFYDRTEILTSLVDEQRNTVDLEFQHRVGLDDRNEVLWGLGYRFTDSDVENAPTLSFDPSYRATSLVSGFLQYELGVLPDELALVLGTKVEHNEYVGFVVQPSGRVTWAPDENHTLWSAVSRAVRTPARSDHDASLDVAFVPGFGVGPDTIVRVVGNDDFRSEDLLAYEMGYRTQVTDTVSLDLAGFYNVYDDLATREPGPPFPGPGGTIVQPLFTDNRMDGVTWGVEMAAQYNVSEAWQLHAGYTLLRMDLDLDGDSGDTQATDLEDASPTHQAHLRSYHDLGRAYEVDAALYYVDNLPGAVDSYVRGDIRLGWRPNRVADVSIGVQGLFHDEEREFADSTFGGIYEVQTSAFLRLSLSF